MLKKWKRTIIRESIERMRLHKKETNNEEFIIETKGDGETYSTPTLQYLNSNKITLTTTQLLFLYMWFHCLFIFSYKPKPI